LGKVLGALFNPVRVFDSQKRRFSLPFASLRFVNDISTACCLMLPFVVKDNVHSVLKAELRGASPVKAACAADLTGSLNGLGADADVRGIANETSR
jgi:hypothetical protein